MKRPSIHEIVYHKQFPKPKQNDPPTFYYHMQRNLVPEVRVEVQTYYGALESLEAQYPGLDYTYEPHRRRLARFPWHRRLFRVFDDLRLTNEEILSICQWEGTKSAKDKYEAETGRRIRDTTADGITVVECSAPAATIDFNSPEELSLETTVHTQNRSGGEQDDTVVDHSEDEEIESVGVQLHDQLVAIADGVTPPEGPLLEAWLKYMNERDADRNTMMEAIRAGQLPPTVPESGRRAADRDTIGETIQASQLPSAVPENMRYIVHHDNQNNRTSNPHRLPSLRNRTALSPHSCPTREEIIAQLNGSVQA